MKMPLQCWLPRFKRLICNRYGFALESRSTFSRNTYHSGGSNWSWGSAITTRVAFRLLRHPRKRSSGRASRLDGLTEKKPWMEWKQRREQSRAKPKYQRPQNRLLNQNQSSIEDSRPWIEMHIESWLALVARPRMQMDSRTASHQRRRGKRGKQVVRRPLQIASTWSRLVEREATASADTGETKSRRSTIHRMSDSETDERHPSSELVQFFYCGNHPLMWGRLILRYYRSHHGRLICPTRPYLNEASRGVLFQLVGLWTVRLGHC